jgi:magnesium-transporting ATPase (P-type)
MADTVNENNNNLIISYLKIRRAIGWLGLLLPFMLLIGNILVNKLNILNSNFFIQLSCYTKPYLAVDSFKSSISHYYYSTVGELFTGVLCAVALFMFCYRGHKLRAGEKGLSDNAMANLAGFFALGVVIFPTGAEGCIDDNLRIFLSSTYTGYIHFTFASLFFISLAVMSMVNFRRTAIREQFGMMKNHKTFLFCGIGMLVCMFLIFIYSICIEKMNISWLNRANPVFCLEAIALILFGTSWLIKGQLEIPGSVKNMFTKK